jgi:hypothetical protein
VARGGGRRNAAPRWRTLDSKGSTTQRGGAEHTAAKARWNVREVTVLYDGRGCVILARGNNQESFSNGHPKSRVVMATGRVV